MKRFWKNADVEHGSTGWAIKLDGRPLRTPARAQLIVPGEKLAKAIADEWRSVRENIDPRSMPLTGLANSAIDRVAPDRQAFAARLARYGEADLACYRAESPRALVALQEESWDPLLSWARRRYDVDFATTCGIVHVPQPDSTIERLTHAIVALDAFRLAGLSPLVTIGGSLVAGLGVLEGAVSPEAAWDSVSVDERWQLDQWGADKEAESALESRRDDFLAAAHFLALVES